MTSDQLRALGELIYGEDWKSPMARDLGVRYRTVLRWVSEEFSIPDRIRPELVAIAKRRVREAVERAEGLKKLVATA
jgi:hypothetical protein